MDEGGDAKAKLERRDLWDRALKRPDRTTSLAKIQREAKAPQRQLRKSRTGERK